MSTCLIPKGVSARHPSEVFGNVPACDRESGFGKANDRGTASVEQYYGEPFKTDKGPLHGSVLSSCEDSVLRGWDPKVLLVRPSPFPSALIQRGGSCPPLPLVELIQKVSSKHQMSLPLSLNLVPPHGRKVGTLSQGWLPSAAYLCGRCVGMGLKKKKMVDGYLVRKNTRARVDHGWPPRLYEQRAGRTILRR